MTILRKRRVRLCPNCIDDEAKYITRLDARRPDVKNDKVQMWVFAYQGWGGLQVESATTKREARRLRGALRHHLCGALERVVLPAPPPEKKEGQP